MLSICHKESKYLFCAVIICMSFFCSCHLNSTLKNREKDKIEGQKVVEKFYKMVKDKKYKETYSLIGSQWFALMDTPEINNMYHRLSNKLGEIENYQLNQWETLVRVGTDDTAIYTYLYAVKREKFSSEEQFQLVKENNEIKIIGYHVNSQGFKED